MDGKTVESVISLIDHETGGFVEGFSLNCCSPHAFDRVISLFGDKNLSKRLIGFYPNSWNADPSTYETEAASEEPRKIDSLKSIAKKGRQYDLKFVGGCCGFGYHDIKLLAGLFAKK